MFFKSSVGFLLSNCSNAEKSRFGMLSQTIKCIQYNIHDTKSCELPNYLVILENIRL